MKILYYVQTKSDYGHDVIYDGLCRVLGSENVLEYPHKSIYHSGLEGGIENYPCYFDYPVSKTDVEKEEILKRNGFDAVIITCGKEVKFEGEFYELLKEKSKTIPFYLVDQRDESDILSTIRRQLSCRLYFKREYLGQEGVIPLSFSYSEKYLPKSIDTERTNPLFWAGDYNTYRREILYGLGRLVNRKKYSQEDYRKELLKARIGLNLRGHGFDTVRYYEIPAHGAMLLSERPSIIIENDFVDGESVVFFDNLSDLKEKLAELFAVPARVDEIRLKGHEHFLKYHTSTARAKQLLDKINL